MKHSVHQEIHGILAFVGAIWVVFLLGYVLPINIGVFGLIPRSFIGLIGIPAMPFLHANFRHIAGNTVPLFVLLTLLAGSRTRSWEIVIEVILLGGLLLWLFGRFANHIGASGLVFGLSVFLVVSGVREGRLVPLLVSVLVAFLYGGAIMGGVIPQFGSSISWDGHLCGAIAGGIIAVAHTGRQPDAPSLDRASND